MLETVFIVTSAAAMTLALVVSIPAIRDRLTDRAFRLILFRSFCVIAAVALATGFEIERRRYSVDSALLIFLIAATPALAKFSLLLLRWLGKKKKGDTDV